MLGKINNRSENYNVNLNKLILIYEDRKFLHK